MKAQGSSVTIVIVAAMIMSFTGCRQVQGAQQSAAPLTGVMVRPAAQKPAPPSQPPTAAPMASPAPAAAAPASPAPAAANSEAPPPNVTASDSSKTFTVAQHTFRLLIHTQRIEGKSSSDFNETTEWWELRNEKDEVVHREAYPVTFQNGGFESTVQISASSFTTQQGSGIFVEGMDLPSAPESGGWVQVFGYKYGRDKYGVDQSLFGPFGPPISIEGEFLGIATDSFQPTPIMGRAQVTVMNDVMNFRVWTGNFNIIYPVMINWITGRLQPAHRCIESTTAGRVERCSYAVKAESRRDNQQTFVRLFPEADEGFTAKHIIVQPESKIEFLEARAPVTWSEDTKTISFGVNGDVWLKVRIDGQEGWIHSEEDFQAVGLPLAG